MNAYGVVYDDGPYVELVGGPCDGLHGEPPGPNAEDPTIMYAGMLGTGVINIYQRRRDGRYYYVRSQRMPRPPYTVQYGISSTKTISIEAKFP